MKIFGYWGKAQEGWHLLPYHSLDVAACAVSLLRHRPGIEASISGMTGLDPDRLSVAVGWAAALHDLGKLSPSFQWKVRDVAQRLGQEERRCPTDVRHDSLGWVLWVDGVQPRLGLSAEAEDRLGIWMSCATGHHGVPPSRSAGGPPIRLRRYFPGEELETACEWVAFVDRLFPAGPDRGDLERLRSASWWIAGLITMADWLGSSREWFPYVPERTDLHGYWRDATRRGEVAVRESGLARTVSRKSFRQLFPHYQPTRLQAEVAELQTAQSFLLILEEATGGGKTEAALAAAGGDGFFFGLPTMATANGLWSRVGSLGGQQGLIHGKRWLLPSAMGRAEAWINDSSRKALLASIGVGTVDQAMLSVLRTRFGALRLAGLAGHTLIIDEVHAYDPYMTRILERLVEFHAKAGGSVVLLSATMPVSVRHGFVEAWSRGRGTAAPRLDSRDFPLLTWCDGQQTCQRHVPSFRRREVGVRRVTSTEAVLDHVASAVRDGRCAVWIRNTVREALEAFDALSSKGIACDLFHARFAQGDRLDTEARVQATFGKSSSEEVRRGRVLVATQVVEQSLDLDFDLMVTDLAPIDLVIQRAGRLHRHDRGGRGVPMLAIHCPTWSEEPPADWVEAWSSGTALVYPDHGRLWLTLRLLGDRITLPDDSRRLVEGVYGAEFAERVPSGLRDNAAKAERRRASMAIRARANLVAPNAPYATDGVEEWDDEEAPTRLGERTREWVLCESGSPIRGDVESSVVSLRASAIARGPECKGVAVGSWRKTLNLVGGSATCERSDGSKLTVRYDARRGLSWSA